MLSVDLCGLISPTLQKFNIDLSTCSLKHRLSVHQLSVWRKVGFFGRWIKSEGIHYGESKVDIDILFKFVKF